jgi:hypothetical protein
MPVIRVIVCYADGLVPTHLLNVDVEFPLAIGSVGHEFTVGRDRWPNSGMIVG